MTGTDSETADETTPDMNRVMRKYTVHVELSTDVEVEAEDEESAEFAAMDEIAADVLSYREDFDFDTEEEEQ